MSISSAGIGSGLDVNAIVTQLVALERRPIVQLRADASRLQSQVSIFGQLQSRLSSLRDAANKLTQPATWGLATASSSNPQAVSATASGSPTPGAYTLVVDRLAAGQALASATAYTDASVSVGSGTLRIELGDFDAVPPVPKAGSSAVDIVIEPDADSLGAIRDQINAAGAGVTASIVNDVNGSRLVIRSRETGLENGFRIQVLADADGNTGDANGLSALAFDPQGFSAMQRTLAADNARATVDGLAIESTTNTLSGVVDGLTLQLNREGPDPVNVIVVQDNDKLRKAVTDFADAYNAVVSLLRDQSRYDPTSKVAGPLQGDRTGSLLSSQLRGLLSDNSGASTVFSRLREIGFDVATEGTIRVDSAKLDAALAQKDELQRMFSARDLENPANDGFGQRFKLWLDGALGVEGVLKSRTDGLQSRIRSNEQQQQRLEDRVLRTEARLLAQYTALDTKMGQLQGLSAYVTQQMTMLMNNNGTRR